MPMSKREWEMREKLARIEGEIIERKRWRRKKLAVRADLIEIDADLSELKQAAGRIRKHLNEGVYDV